MSPLVVPVVWLAGTLPASLGKVILIF
jgi:hypothetical protein